ncbi:MAG: sugar-binding domain-containing protein, partial [Planctomycetota bacterium]
MLLNGEELIKAQLAVTEPTTFTGADNRTTTLTPVRQTPKTDDQALSLSLDGDWQVKRWPFRGSEATLASNKTKDTRWETIPQPGKVFYADPEAERFGEQDKDWNRVTLEHIDERDGAMMRRAVTVPKAWGDKRIILRFDSIFPAGRIYLNGELLGEHLSAMTPIEYDVTDKLSPGRKALIAIRLLRRHKFVKMDMVRHSCEFGGLAQSATLFAVEPCSVTEYQLIPSLEANLTKGNLSGAVQITNGRASAGSGSVALTLLDSSGRKVAGQTRKIKVESGKKKAVRFNLPVKAPSLWNDEFPNLYTVRIELAYSGQAK